MEIYDKQDSKALSPRPLVNASKAKKYMSILKMFKKHSTFYILKMLQFQNMSKHFLNF